MAERIEPFTARTDEGDDSKMLTVTKFVEGDHIENLFGGPSKMLWFSSEQIVRSIGANLANFRKSSQQFAIDNPEAFAGLPMWDTIHDGLEITPITIPVTPESFGAVHGDLHPGNFVIDTENAWAMSILDFDGA